MQLFIDDRQKHIPIDKSTEELLRRVALTCLEVEGIGTDWEVSVSFVTNEEIRELNLEYRGKDEPTDVLSFPFEDEFDLGEKLLGDIVISTEKAIEQALEFEHSIEREITYLAVHSMFHLMGYDHMEEQDKFEMREKEKEAIRRLGIFRQGGAKG
ncbi:MAG: rRNA maturation RNase YbeY [Gudongella sp.]|jgi:probable rRNA maturation factor|nr:rRNA maturation RNase YbeY [Gudongella sp.]